MLTSSRYWICQQAEHVAVLAACTASRVIIALAELSVVFC